MWKTVVPYLCWLFLSLAHGETVTNFQIMPAVALPIGIKIWFNECNGSVDGLVTWNSKEQFASLGIGHFIWYPTGHKNASLKHGFPAFLAFAQKRGARVPSWLTSSNWRSAPWPNRKIFLEQYRSPQLLELRQFLRNTIQLQAEYMATELQNIFPKLLAAAPTQDRSLIEKNFLLLASSACGLYAMIDYLNFKGGGITSTPSLDNYLNGSGLLQVLHGMQLAPKEYTPLRAFVWSAKHALVRRVQNSAPKKHYEQWLAGWFRRLNTYLEGELINL